MKKYIFTVLIILLILISGTVLADYEVTGKYENKTNTYLSNQSDTYNNYIDQYQLDSMWIKLKNKLDYPDYYYLKFEFDDKDYNHRVINNNSTFGLWGNYTNQFNDDYRNKFYFNFTNKEYQNNAQKSYNKYSLNYQFRFDYDQSNRYTFDMDKKNYTFFNDLSKNYEVETYQIIWEREVNEKFQFGIKFEIKDKKHLNFNGSDNSFGQKLSVDFKYEL